MNGYKPKGSPPAEQESSLVAELIDSIGEPMAARRLGISRQTMARIIARRPVYPSTMALVRERLGGRRP